MAGSGLPRELERSINQIANDRANGGGQRGDYRKAYKREKAKLLIQVVTWLATGKSVDEILKHLQVAKRRSVAELRRTVRAITKAIWELP